MCLSVNQRNFHLEPQMAEPQNSKPCSSLNFLCSVIAYYTAYNPWATPDKSHSILYLDSLDIQDSYAFPPSYLYSLILLSLQQCKSRATPMKLAHLCWCKIGIRDISDLLFRLCKEKKKNQLWSDIRWVQNTPFSIRYYFKFCWLFLILMFVWATYVIYTSFPIPLKRLERICSHECMCQDRHRGETAQNMN